MEDGEIIVELEKFMRTSQKNQKLIKDYIESHFARLHGYPEPLLDSDFECAQFLLKKWEESQETRGLLKRFLQLAWLNSKYFKQGLQPPSPSPNYNYETAIEDDLLNVDELYERDSEVDRQLFNCFQSINNSVSSNPNRYTSILVDKNIRDWFSYIDEPEPENSHEKSESFSPKLSSTTIHSEHISEQENKSKNQSNNVTPTDIPLQKYWIEKE